MTHKTTIVILALSITLIAATTVFAQNDATTSSTDSDTGQALYLPITAVDSAAPVTETEAAAMPVEAIDTSVNTTETVEAAAALPTVQAISANFGMFVLNVTTGSVSACTEYNLAGVPPTPAGTCTKFGAVGASASGFIVMPNGNQVFIINKTNGNIFQCTAAVLLPNFTTVGMCKKISSTSLL
ncbi:MAG: hypothetical protein DYG89_43590 [Caldilinea sp. CFX5]|nr:hypothetical protein [Caldilinea sp. CFX5]